VIVAETGPVVQPEACHAGQMTTRFAAQGQDPAVLADVYRENVNIAVWRRELSDELKRAIERVLSTNGSFTKAMTVSPRDAASAVSDSLGTSDGCPLSRNIAELVEMFCCLFELNRTGLRLGVLTGAMCPKFHVDRVPCRLVTTYRGPGTEWLEHDAVDRTKLGMGAGGQPDSRSGLLKKPDEIRQLDCGDVALLKGELWEGNEDAGLVHRSPAVADGDARLLLTLDLSR